MEILPSLLSFIDSKVRTFKRTLADAAENPNEVAEQIAGNLPETIDKTISDPSNFVGGGAGTLISRGAKTWNNPRYIEAVKMKVKGAKDEEIWNRTRTWLDTPDMIPRQEISDLSMALLNPNKWKPSGLQEGAHYQQGQLDELISHPRFEGSYPGLLKELFSKLSKRAGDDKDGKFYSADKRIFAHASDDDNVLKVLAHELQHAVQNKEGFASGGSTDAIIKGDIPEAAAFFEAWKDKLLKAGQTPRTATDTAAYMAYHNLAGEAEARMTASRLYYNDADRLARPPWLDYDINVPLKDLILRFNKRTTP